MTRTEKRCAAAAGVGLVLSLGFLVHPWYVPIADAAMYIATARSLVAGEGYTLLGAPFIIRPPGFSLLLAPLIAWRGTDFLAMNWLVATSGAVAVAFLYSLIRERLGWALALLVCLAVWLNPGYQRFCTQVMSDLPGAAALLGCLLLDRWVRARPSLARESVLGVAIGAAALLRSTNILLVAAVVVARWFGARREGGRFEPRALLSAAVAVLIIAPWFVHQQANAPAGVADQTRLHSYATAMFHEDPGDPGSPRVGVAGILGRVPLRLSQNLSVIGSRLGTHVKGSRDDPFESAPGRERKPVGASPIHLVLGALMLACLFTELVRRQDAPEIFAAASLALLLIYFGFQDRLALPVFLIALPATAAVARDFAGRWLPEPRAAALVGVGLVALIASDLDLRAGWAELESEHDRLTAESAAAASLLPEKGNIAAWRGFHHSVLLDRPVYSLHRSVKRLGEAEGLEAVASGYEIDAVFLTTRGLPRLRDALDARLGSPAREGAASVWRLPPERRAR